MKLALVGCGGIGSFFAFRLSDFLALNQCPEITEVHLYDADCFEDSNRWLQHLGLYGECLFQNKAVSLAAVINAKLPEVEVTGKDRFCTPIDLLDYDIVISAVDTARFRKQLYQTSFLVKKRNPIPALIKAKIVPEDYTGIPKDFFWIDLRSTGKTVAAWVKHPTHTLASLIATLPKEENAKGGCQLPQDVETNTFQNGAPFIAQWGVQILLNHLRNQNVPPYWVYMF